MVHAIKWVEDDDGAAVRIIDQTVLPTEESYLELRTVDQLVDAIARLAVRGAPALGAAGGYGVALAERQADACGWDDARLEAEIERVALARPTAVNLAWGARRVDAVRREGGGGALAEAHRLAGEDEAANRELSRLGADWLLERTGKKILRAITHCNTGALATTAWGTAYGVLKELHTRGALEMVYVDETRPLLQGTRLTSWELAQDGIPHVVEVDGAAASTILRGLVDFAVIGADRIATNGDTANKIGSVSVALAAHRAGIPFLVAAPLSTVDVTLASGDLIEIEERDQDEVLAVGGTRLSAPGVRGFNPAFDVTPHDLITGIVTEHGVVEPGVTQPAFA
ncbi:MAG: S-methyl-5-thioribose-1-phosphate isomerase [Microbacterium sp.]|nr:S-methyl-5-thioribose-1-phosphate isomerase [Microbacterium sp.]